MDNTLFPTDPPGLQHRDPPPVDAPQARYPHNRTETSKGAAARQYRNPGKVAADRAAIMGLARSRGRYGFIRDEARTVLGINAGSHGARINALVNEGQLMPLIDDQGRPVKRPTETGTPAQVLVIPGA